MEQIPFLSLTYQHEQVRHEVQHALMGVYDASLYVLGQELRSFEQEFAAFTGSRFCVGMGNGLDALTAALQSCGVSPADEVIIPAHTYLATWLAVMRCGARPVPVEPSVDTFNIDPRKIERAITARSKVILPVHLYGQACDMTAIGAMAAKHNLVVVEDNAQAHGARWRGQLTGSFGAVSATSFYPTKNLGALGDGGAITTSDEARAEYVRQYRNYGLRQKDIAVQQGINSRLDEIQASVLRVKLRRLQQWTDRRVQLAALYHDTLKGIGDITLPSIAEGASHVYHLFVIRTARRDMLKKYLESRGIGTMVHYPIPPHLQQAYAYLGYKKDDFPIAEQMAATVLSLPLWPGLSDSQVAGIADEIKAFFQ